MPVHTRIFMRLAILLFLFYLMISWQISGAVQVVSGNYLTESRIILLLMVSGLILLPLVVALSYARGKADTLFLRQPQITAPDYFLTFPFWMGLVWVAEMLPWLALLALLGGLFKLFPALRPELWLELKSWGLLGLAVFYLFYVVLRSLRDTWQIRFKKLQIAIPGLPAALQKLRLVFVSDLHVDRYTQKRKLTQMQQQIRDFEGDLLLFGGDIVSAGEFYIDQAVTEMCSTLAKREHIAVMGDHDVWANPERIARGLHNGGFHFLQDEHHIINYDNHQILITGITYIYHQKLEPGEITKLLEKAPAADLKILLAHQPGRPLIELAAKYGYHLFLAGHTHGGQLLFRPLGYPYAFARWEGKYYRGLYKIRDMMLFVTNGVGLTMAPIRYQAQAEVVGIEFSGRNGD